jgi:hypothetical protein
MGDTTRLSQSMDRRKDRLIRDKGRIGQLVWSRGGRRDHAIRRACSLRLGSGNV